MTRNHLAALSLCLGVLACSTPGTWEKPGTSPADYEAAYKKCRYESNVAVNTMSADPVYRGLQAADLHTQCMEANGWTFKPDSGQ